MFALISTCSRLYNTYRLDIISLTISRLDMENVYALKVPLKGRVKAEKTSDTLDKPYRPLVFSGYTSKTEDGELIVAIILPTFLRGDANGQPGDVIIDRKSN
ncbi:hypothetical protein PQX77_022021 [Marasmius sp. AFHP31]|nr:hypothetical protein PQX77_022021 [Marasmius sp. AFHP31]